MPFTRMHYDLVMRVLLDVLSLAGGTACLAAMVYGLVQRKHERELDGCEMEEDDCP